MCLYWEKRINFFTLEWILWKHNFNETVGDTRKILEQQEFLDNFLNYNIRNWYPICNKRNCRLYVIIGRKFAEQQSMKWIITNSTFRIFFLSYHLSGCVLDSQKGTTVGRSFSLSWRSHPDVTEPMRFRSATTSGAPGVEKARNIVRQKATGKHLFKYFPKV